MKKATLFLLLTLCSLLSFSQTTFSPNQILSNTGDNSGRIYSLDLDNDGDLDILYQDSYGFALYQYLNDGDWDLAITKENLDNSTFELVVILNNDTSLDFNNPINLGTDGGTRIG